MYSGISSPVDVIYNSVDCDGDLHAVCQLFFVGNSISRVLLKLITDIVQI